MNRNIKFLFPIFLLTTTLFSQQVEDYWLSQNSNHTYAIHDIDFYNEKNGCAVSSFGKIVVTNDGGENWISVPLNTGRPFYAVKYLTKERVIIAGNLINSIYISNDAGENWQEKELGSPGEVIIINDIFFLGSLHGWMLAIDKILKTVDGGNSWSVIESNAFPNPISTAYYFTSTHFISKNYGWLVDSDGRVLYTEDGGYSWELFDTYNSSFLRKVYFKDSLNGWILGRKSFYTTDGGESWNEINDPLFSEILDDISFSTNKVGWIVGRNSKLLKTIDAGQTWTEVSGYTSTISSIHFSSPSKGWFAGYNGQIWTYDSDLSTQANFINKFKLYPNPSSEFIKIKHEQNNIGELIEIYNIQGKQILSTKILNNQTEINVANFDKGMYFVKIGNEKAKFIKN